MWVVVMARPNSKELNRPFFEKELYRPFFVNGGQRETFLLIPYEVTKAGNTCVQIEVWCLLLQIHMLHS